MDKIFVSIASYRDPELIKTVESIINNADLPDNLRIVVYEQNDPTDSSVDGMYKQVTVLKDHYSVAKGPVVARAKIQRLYQNEEYYLQIDSHMRTIKNWDTILKHMLKLVPEPAVLTQYPPEYMTHVNNICVEHIDPNVCRSGLYIQGFGIKDRFTRIQSDIIINKERHYPYTSKAWSACFSFSKGTIINDAPYDITLNHLFFGEELDITLRLFTRGYYFYSPHVTVFYTFFKRHLRRTYWQDIPSNERDPLELVSRIKLRERILNNRVGPGLMGTKRTVNQYMKFADIADFKNCKLSPCAKAFRRKTKRPLMR
jgi:[Skp1-protein]-hydroxyproline N-acetylglucosaminyltransferase